MKRFLLFVATLVALTACDDYIESNIVAPVDDEYPQTLYASFDEETRTYVEQDKYLRWNAGDEISFFPVTYNLQYQFNGKTGDNNGVFKKITTDLVTGNELNNNYAVYPYRVTTAMSDEGIISFELPATQSYAENSFGVGANTMVAITSGKDDNVLRFKNVCGYLKLKLYGEDITIKSIAVSGNNNEKIAGASTITAHYGDAPEIAVNEEGTTSVTLDCGDGVTIGSTIESATTFWVVLPETAFTGGITITITDVNDKQLQKSTSNEVSIERNIIQPMAELLVEYPVPETWKINYTATSKVEPYAPTVFGANYVSSKWNETTGEGVMIFDGEVTTIGQKAFYNCTALTSITIPSGVTSILGQAFYGCTSLSGITIPEEVTIMAETVFAGCTSLPVVDGVRYADTFLVGVVDTTISSCNIKEGTRWIGYKAFRNCTALTNIAIPSGVTLIGSQAFEDCTSLASVTIPNSVENIWDYAFYNCKSLQNVVIPNSVRTIGTNAFARTLLTSIVVPDSVTSLDEGVFASCYSLESATIGNGITSLPNRTFDGCNSLVDVQLPEGLVTIGEYAFFGCSFLKKITIPSSVTSIEHGAFWNSTRLEVVHLKGANPPQLGDAAFEYRKDGDNYTLSLVKFYVPSTAVEAYKTAWSSMIPSGRVYSETEMPY